MTKILPLVSENVIGGQSDGIPGPQKILFQGNRLTLKWERVYRVGAGLHNLGNTCFLNSTVQCLTYTPPLANYLLSKEHSRTCEYSRFQEQFRKSPCYTDVLGTFLMVLVAQPLASSD